MKGLELTEVAVSEVKKIAQEQKMDLSEYGVRAGIAGGGCSGFQYSFGFEPLEKITDQDDVQEQDGVKVIVDKRSMLYLDGTILDFQQDLSQRGFVFNNPHAVKTCGCGSSFQV